MPELPFVRRYARRAALMLALPAMLAGGALPALAQQTGDAAPQTDAPAADDTSRGVSTAAPSPKPADAAERAAQGDAARPASPAGPDGNSLLAQLETAEGTMLGQAVFTETASGQIVVSLMLENVPPGPHAIHLHETGSCEGPSFDSAGGHLADGRKHGVLDPDGPHPGDMPNLNVPETGLWQGDLFLAGLDMDQLTDADGTALVLHEGADDYHSQPAGDAGGRLACGVLEVHAD